HWAISFRALPELLLRGNDPLAIFSSLAELGPVYVTANLDAVPRLRQIDAERCYLSWTLRLESNCSREQVDAAFEWAAGDCEVSVERIDVAAAPTVLTTPEPVAVAASTPTVAPPPAPTAVPTPTPEAPKAAGGETPKAAGSEHSSIRVSIEKI